MRIGILTFHFADNYGAVLQAYALQTYLESLGHAVFIIDYQPRYMTHGGNLRFPRSKRDFYANATVLFIKFTRFRAALTGKSRDKAFHLFRSKHLNIRGRKYISLAELETDPPVCDAYICGSDQIWNPPPRTGVDGAYYLAFGNQSCRRISYAASFGRAMVEDEYKEQIAEFLKRLNNISVREESAVHLVRNLTGRPSAWVPDPALLLSDYRTIISQPEDDNFIFSYCLCGNALIASVQERVAKQLNAQIILPYNSQQHWSSGGKSVHLGPSEWLGHIYKARAVVTNSFHGTVFCILFHKPFISIPLGGRKKELTERLTSLLSRMGLLDRLGEDTEGVDISLKIEKPIDWDSVDKRMQIWKDEARNYLLNALFQDGNNG